MVKAEAVRGRPPLPPELRRRKLVAAAVTEHEHERLIREAERRGESLSDLIRRWALAELAD